MNGEPLPRRRRWLWLLSRTAGKTRWGRVLCDLAGAFGPGLITGAADDDPSGIGTYAQTGAAYGLGLLWMALWMLPLQIAVQEACARIGAVTGQGLAAAARRRYGRPLLVVLVGLVVLANTANIGADLSAMEAASVLLAPAPPFVYPLLYTVAILAAEVFLSYRRYAALLRVLTLSLLAYLATALLVREPWRAVLVATLVPQITFAPQTAFLVTGILGTTISPYLFFWQASQEVEEERALGLAAVTMGFVRHLRLDTLVGMLFSEVGTWAIILTTATVLHAAGVTQIATAAQAASALLPLVHTFPNAGLWARSLFAAGIIGLGLLGIPTLAGSASYAVCDLFGWAEGLDLSLVRARGFYGVMGVATALGLALTLLRVDPIAALLDAAVINGVVAVPLLVVVGMLAQSRVVMGEYASGWFSRVLVWATVAVMGGSALGLGASLFLR